MRRGWTRATHDVLTRALPSRDFPPVRKPPTAQDGTTQVDLVFAEALRVRRTVGGRKEVNKITFVEFFENALLAIAGRCNTTMDDVRGRVRGGSVGREEEYAGLRVPSGETMCATYASRCDWRRGAPTRCV